MYSFGSGFLYTCAQKIRLHAFSFLRYPFTSKRFWPSNARSNVAHVICVEGVTLVLLHLPVLRFGLEGEYPGQVQVYRGKLNLLDFRRQRGRSGEVKS
jgi:hypothetical protein